MAEMNIVKAVNSALDNMLEKDENVLFFGQDAGYFGGVFGTSEGLQNKFGSHRVFDTPLSEGGIAAIAFGMGINGLRPVAEIQFADYIFPAYDQIVNEIAKVRHRSGGEFWCPVTFRTPAGGGIRGGHHHSQSPESQFTHTPGLKVVYASTPYNAKGLLIAAIECNDPVIVLEPKRCYRGPFYGDPHNDLHSKETNAQSSPGVRWSTSRRRRSARAESAATSSTCNRWFRGTRRRSRHRSRKLDAA